MNKETINKVLRLNKELEALKKAKEKLSLRSTALVMFDDYHFKKYGVEEYYMEDILRSAKVSVMEDVDARIYQIEQELEEL